MVNNNNDAPRKGSTAGAAIAAGIAGAALGAAAVALSNKETRKKLGQKMRDAQKRGDSMLAKVRKSTAEMARKAEQKTQEARSQAARRIEGK